MKKTFRIIAAVFAIMVFLSGVMGTLPPKPVYATSGSGTSEDPYVITTPQDLQDMNLNPSAYYALGGDIDCSITSTWNDGQGFLPLGTWDMPFTGGLNGNNYTISNLYINRTDEYSGQSQGLFCYCEDAAIQNLTLENFNIHARYDSAPLCSDFHNGTITNVHVVNATVNLTGTDYADWGAAGLCASITSSNATGCTVDSNTTVTGFSCGGMFCVIGYSCYIYDCTSSAHVMVYGGVDDDGIGGVFCDTNSGEIERCIASGQVEVVSGLAQIGGFVAENSREGKIRSCYSISTVQVTKSAYGAASGGFAVHNYGDIGNCYSRGSITSTAGRDVGGFVGFVGYQSDEGGYGAGTTHQCYSTGAVSTSGYAGGFAAASDGDEYIVDCFCDYPVK